MGSLVGGTPDLAAHMRSTRRCRNIYSHGFQQDLFNATDFPIHIVHNEGATARVGGATARAR